MDYLNIINFGFVLLFGVILSLSFSGIELKENYKQYLLIFSFLGVIQIIVYYFLGYDFLFKSYPILTHLPLFLTLKFYFKKGTYMSAIAVLSAYLFCTPRKWIGTFVSFFWDYDINVSYIVQIIITIPLLILIVKFISPYVARLKYESNRILKFFIVVPLLYYIFEYILTVYTDILYRGGAVIIEYMDAAVVVVYFIFSVIYLKTLYEKKEVEIEQALLKVVSEQSQLEIEALKKSDRQARIYRHDLRHHMIFLNTCIKENNTKNALEYIEKVYEDLDKSQTIRYSENDTVNLILSSYITKAKEKEINCDVSITTTDFSNLSAPDLCSLLSNTIENAIHASEKINDTNKRIIRIVMYTKNDKLCIDIRNSFNTEPKFYQGIPMANEKEHGFGTRSIAHVVEKYGGVYQFSVNDGWFIFQTSI